MIRKFAAVFGARVVAALLFATMAAGAAAPAQSAPSQNGGAPAQETTTQQDPAQPAAQQTQPAEPQSSSAQQSGQEETAPEETIPRHRVKPKEYRNWTYNAGLGASATNGTTKTFVRSGGYVIAAGVARNYSKYFGLRLDFQFDNLPLRNTALEQAQAPGATSHVYSLMAGPIINLPVTKVWTGYLVIGPGFFHRTGKLDSSGALPGYPCSPFFTWWGRCYSGSLPFNGNFLREVVNEPGLYFGGGLSRKVYSHYEIYADFRYVHGTHRGITTDFRPITLGLRW
jgi:hypothetical protein